jgi:putative ABC transport system permease protein
MFVNPRFIGRLGPSVSADEVRAQAQMAVTRLEALRADGKGGTTIAIRPAGVKSTSGIPLEIAAIMLVPAIVLLIACVNAANLLLVRGQQRSRDIAVRLALGASRWRIVRELLIECVLLAVLSAALTVPFVIFAVRGLESLLPVPLRVDPGVIVFAVAASLASVLLFGLAPALRLSRDQPAPALGSRAASGYSRSRLRKGLVVAQVAVSIGLLATGSQLIDAVAALSRITGAADPERLLLVSFDLTQFQLQPAAQDAFYGTILERVRQIPGVERAGMARASAVWTFGGGSAFAGVSMWLPGAAPKDGRYLIGGYAGGDLFDAIGLRLLQGRAFEPKDRVGRPRTALVSRAAAERYFNGHAVGQTVRVAAPNTPYESADDVEIVGVIESARDPNYMRTPDAAIAAMYLPVRQDREPALALYVRAAGAPHTLLPAIRRAVDASDARVPFAWTGTLLDRRYDRQSEERLAAEGLTILGFFAIALATSGLYGMVSFIVSTRRREVGVRMALGARPRGILALMLNQGLRMAGTGAAIGGALALFLSGWLRSTMHGIPPLDGLALAAPAALLVAATLAASLVPARRAARVDPLVVLREE